MSRRRQPLGSGREVLRGRQGPLSFLGISFRDHPDPGMPAVNAAASVSRRAHRLLPILALSLSVTVRSPAQQMATETRDPKQAQDTGFATRYKHWTGDSKWGSPLVDHLPVVNGIPTPRDIIGYDVGAPKKLT